MVLKTTLGLLIAPSILSAGITYSVTSLGINDSSGCGLATNGNVVCGNQFYNATTGVTSTISALPNLTSSFTNASGEIAGVSGSTAYFYKGSTVETLPLPSGSSNLKIYGIDNNGDVVGNVTTSSGNEGVYWTTYGSGPAIAATISGADYGFFISPNSTLVWDDGNGIDYVYYPSTLTYSPIDSVGSSDGPTAVSNAGIVVGGGWNSTHTFQSPYEASAGSLIRPCTSATNCSGANLLGGDGIEFTGVNSSGQAVGINTGGTAQHPFLYSGGKIQDLNSLLAASGGNAEGWYLWSAEAINDSGQILAIATNGSIFAEVLLTPIPEPGTLTLFAAGALLFYVGSRRKTQRNRKG